jgi:arylsulfatase
LRKSKTGIWCLGLAAEDEQLYRDYIGAYYALVTEIDARVGEIFAELEKTGMAENTIVIYTTDNGAEKYSWPDGGTSPFRGEKASTWEGGVRVPFMIRWPGKIKAGTVSNEILSLEDAMPTLAAAAGAGDVVSKFKAGTKVGGETVL